MLSSPSSLAWASRGNQALLRGQLGPDDRGAGSQNFPLCHILRIWEQTLRGIIPSRLLPALAAQAAKHAVSWQWQWGEGQHGADWVTCRPQD